jgi:PKD repeat protein
VSSESTKTLTPIHTKNNTTGTAINVGTLPVGISITPDQSPVASFTATAAPHGSATMFDASASYPRSSPLASYAWSFGDTTTAKTTTPQTSHVYTAAGTYTVVLVVTDAAGTATRIVFTGQTVSRHGSSLARKRLRITIT